MAGSDKTLPVDISTDMRADAGGKDPDSHSTTLRRYHQLLWSKPLPDGQMFDLDTTRRGAYLYHASDLGEFFLSSDSVIPTYHYWQSTSQIINQLPSDDVTQFHTIGYSIGGMMLFPGNRVNGKWTINMARGMNRAVGDRMDLTLECIRRHYAGEAESPLAAVLARYDDFFSLFGDFKGYVDFFLLQDLTTAEYSAVKFFTDFHNFDASAVPRDVATYTQYRQASIEFVEARNARIAQWAAEHLTERQQARP